MATVLWPGVSVTLAMDFLVMNSPLARPLGDEGCCCCVEYADFRGQLQNSCHTSCFGHRIRSCNGRSSITDPLGWGRGTAFPSRTTPGHLPVQLPHRMLELLDSADGADAISWAMLQAWMLTAAPVASAHLSVAAEPDRFEFGCVSPWLGKLRPELDIDLNPVSLSPETRTVTGWVRWWTAPGRRERPLGYLYPNRAVNSERTL